jgi:hypothetical protein
MTAQSARYEWKAVNVGYPSAFYTWTARNISFVATGAPPYCAVSPSNPITPKSVSPFQPAGSSSPQFWAVPAFSFQPITNPISAGVQGTPGLQLLTSQLQLIVQQVNSIGKALQALAGGVATMQNNATNKTTPQNNPSSPYPKYNVTSFTEVPGTRVTTQHTIYNPTDHTQYVVIEQIDGLTWQNGQGTFIFWSR